MPLPWLPNKFIFIGISFKFCTIEKNIGGINIVFFYDCLDNAGEHFFLSCNNYVVAKPRNGGI